MDFKRDPAGWGLLLLVLVGVLGADFLIGQRFVEAVRSESFDTTPGVITKSEIGRGGRGQTRFDVEYTYTVNGRQHTGRKYHVQPQLVGSGYWLAARDAHPVGTPVTVFVDPDDPATAYLSPGLRSDALFVVWFLAPFNLVMAGIVWSACWLVRKPRDFDPALRRCVAPTWYGYRARPRPENRFVVVCFASLLLITFLGCFAVAGYLLVFDFPPPWWVPLTAWGLALSAAVVLGAAESRRAALRVNEVDGTVVFLVNGQRTVVPRERVRGVDVTTEPRTSNAVAYEVFVVTILWTNVPDLEESTKLAEYEDRVDADALADWLRERLGLPANSSHLAPPPYQPA